MVFSAHKILVPLVMIGCLSAGGRLAAAAPEVKDAAEFFSPAAVAKANEAIKEIKLQYHKDLAIDTFKTIPAERNKDAKDLKGEARTQFYKQWVEDQIRAAKLSGIYVLITKDPPHIQVGVTEDTLKKAFPPADRDRLAKLLLEKFKTKEYDDGLLEGIKLVRATFAKNVPPSLPPPVVNVVKDHGQFFEAATVQKANEELRQIHDKTGKNIIVATVQKVPAPANKKVEDMTREERNRFFGNLMVESGRHVSFAVFILVSREPSHLQILVGPEGQKNNLFATGDRDRLSKMLLDKFSKKEFDQGLLDGLGFIRQTLFMGLNISSNAPTAQAAGKANPTVIPAPVATGKASPAVTSTTQKAGSVLATRIGDAGKQGFVGAGAKQVAAIPEKEAQTFPWTIVLWIGLGLLGLWIVFGLIRGLSTSRQQNQQYGQYGGNLPPPAGYGAGQRPPAGAPGYGPGGQMQPPAGPGYGAGAPGYGPGGGYGPPPSGGGGGGFLSGMLGGMFGAAAGNWVYDSFARRPQGGPGGMMGGGAYGGEPRHYENRPVPPSSTSPTGGGYSSTGGDFAEPSDGRVESSGGDFGVDAEKADTGAGGDFGQEEEASTGGDFGQEQDAGTGSDTDSGGGDFGSGGDSSGGGDFGGSGDSGSGSSGDGGDF